MSEILVEKDEIQGITIYRFFKNNRDAVDQFLLLADEAAYIHLASDNADKPMLYVLDVSRSGMFSLSYSEQKSKPLVEKHKPSLSSYIAYVIENLNDKILVDMFDAMTARKLQSTRKVFQTQQMDEAVEWLLSVREQIYTY